MTAHVLDDAGALVDAAERKLHPLDWSLVGKWGLHSVADVVFFTQTFPAHYAHQYLITGCLDGIGMAFKTAQPRAYYAKVEGTKVWETHIGAVHNGGAVDALVNHPVPILGLWTAPDDREATLIVGMTRAADQDWELNSGVHNVHVIDLGGFA